MSSALNMINSVREDRGASAVEYSLLAAGIAAAIVVVVFLLGGGANGLVTDGCDAYNADGLTRCDP